MIISGLCIKYGEEELGRSRFLADPLASFAIVLIIVAGTIPLVKRCFRILLQSAPAGIDTGMLGRMMRRVDGVLDVHDLHVWQLNDAKIIGTVHALVEADIDYLRVSDELKLIMHDAGIHATTVQPEFIDPGAIDGAPGCNEPVCSNACVSNGVSGPNIVETTSALPASATPTPAVVSQSISPGVSRPSGRPTNRVSEI